MSSDRRTKFVDTWTIIRDELLEHFRAQGMPEDAAEWYKLNLDYNVPGGKLNRGMSVVDTAEILLGRPLDDKEYLRAAVLGWGIELLQAFFLVSDDMMDSSITRRGQPCWYRVTEPIKPGMIAINDSFMLEAAIYYLLKKHFKGESYYVDILELFHETTYQTEFGQLIDLITAPEDEVDLSKFSLKKHSLIVIYKTAYYSFYLPVALALLFVGVPQKYNTPSGEIDPYKTSLDILLPLGEYFQVQDDFLDFSGTPEQIGKVGTDIVDNKCSWVVNTALAHVTPEQRKLLDEHYGVKPSGGESEKKIKVLFEELDIRGKYAEYEENVVNDLKKKIDAIPEVENGLKKEVFTSFLGKIYKRQK